MEYIDGLVNINDSVKGMFDRIIFSYDDIMINQKCHLDEGHRDESSITLQGGYFFVHRKNFF